MAAIDRQFYQSWRGPGPTDQDRWWLVFDAETRRLLVRHEWQTARHRGFDEFEVAEFLQQQSRKPHRSTACFPVPADA